MKYYIKTMEKEVIIINRLSEIIHITNFIKELGGSLQLPSETIMNISLAVEEAIVNVIKNADPQKGEQEIRLKVNVSSNELAFILTDKSAQSNLTSTDLVWENLSTDQNFLDKLGLSLIHQIMNEVTYESKGEENQLTMKMQMDIEIKNEKTMRINVCNIEGITIISIDGRLDTVNAKEFDDIVKSLLENTKHNILINCENLTYISSSGIRSLISLQKSIVRNKGRLAMEAMKPEIRKIFDMTGCSSIFTIQ